MARAREIGRSRGAVVGGAAAMGALLAVVVLASLGLVGAQAAPALTPAGEVYRDAAPGVVRIVSRDANRKGSGFLLSRDGLLATNAHVVGNAEDVIVNVPGGPDRAGTVVHRDAAADLAFVRIADASDLRPLRLATDATVSVGDPVVAIGAPFGLQRSVSAGIVSGLARQIPGEGSSTIGGAIQTDAALNPGNSGGPLVAADGSVIGVATRIATRSGTDEGVGFAIPASAVAEALDVAVDAPAARGYLGVVTLNLDGTIASAEGLPPETTGVLVAKILPTGNALRDGIRLQDVIVSVEGVEISDNRDLSRQLARHAPGDTVGLTVRRGADVETLSVALGPRPPEA